MGAAAAAAAVEVASTTWVARAGVEWTAEWAKALDQMVAVVEKEKMNLVEKEKMSLVEKAMTLAIAGTLMEEAVEIVGIIVQVVGMVVIQILGVAGKVMAA